MEHILNIAFNFDDEKITKTAEETITNHIDDIVESIILDKIAPYKTNYCGYAWNLETKKERDYTDLYDRIDDRIDLILESHKEEIIDRAATKLVESYRRTKVWKEKAGEIIS